MIHLPPSEYIGRKTHSKVRFAQKQNQHWCAYVARPIAAVRSNSKAAMNAAHDPAINYVLRSKDAARFIGCSLSHFRRLYAHGKLPAPIRLGERRLGWRIRDLDVWLESQRMTNVPHCPRKSG